MALPINPEENFICRVSRGKARKRRYGCPWRTARLRRLRNPPHRRRSSRPAKFLLVDDDTLTAASTAALLEDLGHDVVEAHSGGEALAILNDGLVPDLVITDQAMPGMKGTDLVAVALRARHPNLPILLATGYAELQADQPFDLPRLAKPYTLKQLSLEITRLLPQLAAS